MKKIFVAAGAIFSLWCGGEAWLWTTSAAAKTYVAEPLLVEQPAYAGMRFYVYKPYDMPSNWYVTFDGYPVTKNRDGVWVYGTNAGPSLTPTNYIVGSVIPSMAGLSPWTKSVHISSVSTLPQLRNSAPAGKNAGAIAVQQPKSGTTRIPEGKLQSTYVPDWFFNTRFMALGNWKQSVDRIGILHKPAIPVAWRGNHPKVIYAWNGRSWYQMILRESQTPAEVLKENIYSLVRMVNRNNFIWYEADMPVLSQQAAVWGYYWMGEIVPSR
ncbi:MAG: hypothetical protein LBR61_02150 [Synergistaceae bacterium]|jgi:hypothetical protein|nr:hypothetical protein [Synergistaceae bacterium]